MDALTRTTKIIESKIARVHYEQSFEKLFKNKIQIMQEPGGLPAKDIRTIGERALRSDQRDLTLYLQPVHYPVHKLVQQLLSKECGQGSFFTTVKSTARARKNMRCEMTEDVRWDYIGDTR